MSKPLIDSIEINYFRSIHQGDLTPCKPLNIIVGGNDCGKSNVLRALNLFFKNKTDLGVAYNFERDLSLRRLRETRKGKTKTFLYIKITFNNILGYKSLPAKFTVKKQWNRYSENPETYYFPKNIRQGTVVRFMNQIELHYVPAIKSREIFSYYLELLHDVLAKKNVDLSGSASQLNDVISLATHEMSKQIEKGIGISSRISVPQDFRSLFGGLDFMTAVGDKREISLKQRGDGIQVGHIPYILDFIGKERGDKASIWVYEEPENSLEMTKGFELAEKFSKDFSKRNQIFVTTHSPAFYSLEGKDVAKWQVNKIKESANDSELDRSVITAFKNLSDVDGQLGVASLVAERAKEIFDERKKLYDELEVIKSATKPVLLCEGKTDFEYIKTAFSLFKKQSLLKKFEIREVGKDGKGSGCDSLKAILKDRKERPYLYHSKAFLVFDCDVLGLDNQNAEATVIFKFKQQADHPFTGGIENALSKEIAKKVKEDTKNYTEKEQSNGFKKIQEFNKVKVCSYICKRENKDDFLHFDGLIKAVETFLEEP